MISMILENSAAIRWIILGIATGIRLRDDDRRANALMSKLEKCGGDLQDE